MKITINLDGYDVGADMDVAAQVVAQAWRFDPNTDVRIKGINKKDQEFVWYNASRLFDMGAKR